MGKSLFKIIAFTVISVTFLYCIYGIYSYKFSDGISQMETFYELEDNTVDLLVLGSSIGFVNFNNGTLWDEYGIASYNLGGSKQPLWNTYYYLKEALKTQHPQLIILEAYSLNMQEEFGEEAVIIKNTYGIKWNQNRIDALKVSAPSKQYNEYLLDYARFHTRYNSLEENDFIDTKVIADQNGRKYYENWKGQILFDFFKPFEAIDVSGVEEREVLKPKVEEYYRKVLELAIENNIPILVVAAPIAGIDEHLDARYNTGSDIAGEYGVQFFDGNKCINDIGIDFATDVVDVGHMNCVGSDKFTRFMGDYIKARYELSDRRGDIRYKSWEDNALYTRQCIYNYELNSLEDSNEVLNKIRNPYYEVIICTENGIEFTDINGSVWTSGTGEAEKYLERNRHDIGLKRTYDDANERFVNSVIVDKYECIKVSNGINIVIYDTVTDSIAYSAGVDENGSVIK